MTHPASRIIGHYEKHAIAWASDRRSAPWNDRIWHERFVEALAPGQSVLDLGCGPGFPVAAHFPRRGLKVTGVDSSPTMISLCRQRLPDHEWIVADMRNLSLDRRFNGILAWDSFFHLDHESQREIFAVFAAHALPGAMLTFNTGPQHAEEIGEYRGDPLYHTSLAPGEYQNLISRSGFEVIDHVVEDSRAGGRTVWLCRSLKS
jgi:cyclopropane fatty-acyl-phospholipid synthase-like methyltransferase